MSTRTTIAGVTCAHCGELVPSTRLSSPDATALVFCCAGCQSVYELLGSHNMCEYYALDEQAGVRQADVRAADEYDVLDNSEVAARFTEWSRGTLQRLRFHIPAMHCASCVWLLDQLHRQESLAYDATAAARQHAKALGSAASIESNGSAVHIRIPWESSTQGTITCYRPSAPKLDRSFALAPDSAGVHTIPVGTLQSGLWTFIARWTTNGTAFEMERQLSVWNTQPH